MTADRQDHTGTRDPPSSPVSLRTGFIQRHGVTTGWRTGAAVLIGGALLLAALVYFGVAA